MPRRLCAELVAGGFQVLLVLDGLLLDGFERHQPPLPVVALELVLGRLAVPDLREPRGEIDRVVDAAVHAHAAERIVDVGGVADQERAAELEGLRHPLMHLVERGVRDLVVGDARHHARHQRLRELLRLHALVACVLVHQEHRAPQPGDLQQEIPALRIGHVAHRRQAGDDAEEVERRRDHQQPVGPGEALELDAERAPHRAARAVRADQIAAAADVSRCPPRAIVSSTPDASCVAPTTSLPNSIAKFGWLRICS